MARILTDRTIIAGTGASQMVVDVNTKRRTFIMKNGAANAVINLVGGAAALGGAGCMTMLPYDFMRFTDDDCPSGQVFVLLSPGTYFSCFEG